MKDLRFLALLLCFASLPAMAAYRTGVSAWSTAECCWANFAVPVLSNIYPNDGSSYSNAFTISGMNPWNNPNVPVGNNGSNTTQIPTGSNFLPGLPIVHLRNHVANDDYFEQLMTGTGTY
jgi:hypothetical protein